MRLLLVALLGLISCGRTEQDSDPARAGAGGVPVGNAGSPGLGAAPSGGSESTGGSAGSAAGGIGNAGAGGTTSAGAGGMSAGEGGDATGGNAAGGAGAGGEGGALDLTEYGCETYQLGECVDGVSSGASYACCPLAGDAPCVTGFRTSRGDDFRCGNDSCLCESRDFDTSCYGSNNRCLEKPVCETIWQYRHVYQGEHPNAGFNPYYAQITLIPPQCGSIGGLLDNHRVGSFSIYALDECWRLGTKVTSQLLIDGESGTLELFAPPMVTPPFGTRAGYANRLELDVHRVSWDEDSLLIDVTWRAVACD